MTLEVWKPITGFPGYEVSDLGRVRSLDRELAMLSRWGDLMTKKMKGRVLALADRNGYSVCALGAGNQSYVHRLVALYFVDGFRSDLQVNHKDGDRKNNVPSNLEWVTVGDNNRHAFATLPRKAHSKTRATTIGGVAHVSIHAAARSVGVSASAVMSAIEQGRRVRGLEVSYGVSRS